MPAASTRIVGDLANPNDLFIFGLDPLPPGLDASEVEHLDDTIHIHQPIPDWFLEDIAKNGVTKVCEVQAIRYTKPVAARAEGESKDAKVRAVINGRTRIRAARMVNAKLLASGGKAAELILVPYILIGESTDLDVQRHNIPGRVDPPIVRGRLVAMYRKRKRSYADIQSVMVGYDGQKTTVDSLKLWESLTRLPDEIQAAIESGKIGSTHGYELARAPTPEDAMTAFRALLGAHPLVQVSAVWETGRESSNAAANVPMQGLPVGTPAAAPARPPTVRETRAAVANVAAGRPAAPNGPGAKLPTARQLADIAEALRPAEGDEPDEDDGPRDLLVAALSWAAGGGTLAAVKARDALVYDAIVKVMTPAAPRTAQGSPKQPGKHKGGAL